MVCYLQYYYPAERRLIPLQKGHYLWILNITYVTCYVCLHSKLIYYLSPVWQKAWTVQWLFFSYLCILQDLATRKMIGLGKQRDGLYHLVALANKKSTNNSPSNNQPTCNLTTKSTDLWHSRLGHLSPSRLRFIAKKFLNISIQSNNACIVCSLAKQSRLPFNPSSISSVKAFDIIHCDI